MTRYRFTNAAGDVTTEDLGPMAYLDMYLDGSAPNEAIVAIVREDQVLVSPREVHERAMELWVNEGAPGDELPEGRHYRRALADLEGEEYRTPFVNGQHILFAPHYAGPISRCHWIKWFMWRPCALGGIR